MADDVWIPLVDEPIGSIVGRIQEDDPEISRLAAAKPPPGITYEEHLVRTETFAELTRRFSQIREALLDLDPEPEIRLRLDQILTVS